MDNSLTNWIVAGKGWYAQEATRFLASLKNVYFHGCSEQIEKKNAPSYLLYTGSLSFEHDHHEAVEELHHFIDQWVQVTQESRAHSLTFLLARPFIPGTAERTAEFFKESNLQVSVAVFPLLGLKKADSHSPAWHPPAFIIGCSKETRAIKELRRLLGRSGHPVMLMPARESEMLNHLHISDRVSIACIMELAGSPNLSQYDWVTIMRGLGLHQTVGQHTICTEDIPIEWICRMIGKYIVTARGDKPSVAVWHSVGARINRIRNKLEQMGCELQFYCPESTDEKIGGRELFPGKWEVIREAQVLIILTSHKEFSHIMLSEWKIRLQGRGMPLVIDCCGLYEPAELQAIGCRYISYGREIFITF